jgi:hypothetical protein
MKDNFNKYLIFNFGGIFLAIIIAFVAYSFISQDITAKTNKFISDRTLISKQNDALASFSKIKQEVTKITPYQSAMDKLLPSQNELINFPDWLQGTAATFNVVETFSFASGTVPAKDLTPGSVNFSLAVDGMANDDISFLKYIESSAPGYLLSFTSFSLVNNPNDTKITLNGKIYFK